MWKIAVGFVIFSALALYMLSIGGEIHMGGEKHGSLSSPTVVTTYSTVQKVS